VLQINARERDSIRNPSAPRAASSSRPGWSGWRREHRSGLHDRTPARRDAKLRNFALTRTARSTWAKSKIRIGASEPPFAASTSPVE
jgi:hypothetical protein